MFIRNNRKALSLKNGISKGFFGCVGEEEYTEHTAGVQKVKKVSKKVLTFGCQNDILIKLTRERAGSEKQRTLKIEQQIMKKKN